jgi:glycosyltransferase involved in cell wall biosynthesis
MRWCWNYEEYVEREQLGKMARRVLPFFITGLRVWDQTSAMRVDHFIANSPVIAERIQKYYRREAVVIPPPVEASRFPSDPATEVENDFLLLGRFVPYKRFDLAIEACNRLQLPLVVIGKGRDEERLKRMAGPTIRFLGRLSDEEVIHYYRHCRAFLFPGDEDFGITPLEAQAAGRPVIAYGDGVTGAFFREQTVESLVEVLATFNERDFDPHVIRNHALEFDTPRFQRRIMQFIEAKLSVGKSKEIFTSTNDLV